MTRIRLGRSDLNARGFEIQKVDSPSCLCHFKNETPMHYFLDCFLYTIEHQLLLDQVGQLVTNFNQMPKYKQLNILIYGFLDNDFYVFNKEIAKHVQTYILQTKRVLIKQDQGSIAPSTVHPITFFNVQYLCNKSSVCSAQ